MMDIIFVMVNGDKFECKIDKRDLDMMEHGIVEGRGTYRMKDNDGKIHIVALRHVTYVYEV